MVPALPLYIGASTALLPIGAFLGGCLGVGYSGVTPVLTTSLFPEHVRGRAIGVVYHVGAMIGALAPVMISELATETSLTLSTSIALVAGSALVLMSIAVLVLRREITMPHTAGVAKIPVAYARDSQPSAPVLDTSSGVSLAERGSQPAMQLEL
jgi:SHS family lactate transporter-like MFS transporter